MPLSDHEQKMLAQMEQALAAEDPRFASQMQGAQSRSAVRRRYILGAIGVLLGLGLVLVGVNTTIWVGVAGFVVMVLAAVFALTPKRPGDGSALGRGGRRKGGGPRRQGLMDRLDERWEHRENDL